MFTSAINAVRTLAALPQKFPRSTVVGVGLAAIGAHHLLRRKDEPARTPPTSPTSFRATLYFLPSENRGPVHINITPDMTGDTLKRRVAQHAGVPAHQVQVNLRGEDLYEKGLLNLTPADSQAMMIAIDRAPPAPAPIPPQPSRDGVDVWWFGGNDVSITLRPDMTVRELVAAIEGFDAEQHDLRWHGNSILGEADSRLDRLKPPLGQGCVVHVVNKTPDRASSGGASASAADSTMAYLGMANPFDVLQLFEQVEDSSAYRCCFIKQLSGGCFMPTLGSNPTVRDLCNAISTKTGIPAGTQVLIFCGRQINDQYNLDRPLMELIPDLMKHACMHLVTRTYEAKNKALTAVIGAHPDILQKSVLSLYDRATRDKFDFTSLPDLRAQILDGMHALESQTSCEYRQDGLDLCRNLLRTLDETVLLREVKQNAEALGHHQDIATRWRELEAQYQGADYTPVDCRAASGVQLLGGADPLILDPSKLSPACGLFRDLNTDTPVPAGDSFATLDEDAFVVVKQWLSGTSPDLKTLDRETLVAVAHAANYLQIDGLIAKAEHALLVGIREGRLPMNELPFAALSPRLLQLVREWLDVKGMMEANYQARQFAQPIDCTRGELTVKLTSNGQTVELNAGRFEQVSGLYRMLKAEEMLPAAEEALREVAPKAYPTLVTYLAGNVPDLTRLDKEELLAVIADANLLQMDDLVARAERELIAAVVEKRIDDKDLPPSLLSPGLLALLRAS